MQISAEKKCQLAEIWWVGMESNLKTKPKDKFVEPPFVVAAKQTIKQHQLWCTEIASNSNCESNGWNKNDWFLQKPF